MGWGLSRSLRWRWAPRSPHNSWLVPWPDRVRALRRRRKPTRRARCWISPASAATTSASAPPALRSTRSTSHHPGSNPDVWERVVAKLRAGSMPPPGRPRPDAATYARLRASLEGELDRAWAAGAESGTDRAVHRLNRTEYNNADSRSVRARPRREVAAAGRRHRRRQLRQLRRRAFDLDRAPRTLSVGRPPGDAAGDRPSACGAEPADVRDSAARRAGRSAERRSAVRIARRHRRPLPLPGRRRVPDQESGCAASIRTT